MKDIQDSYWAIIIMKKENNKSAGGKLSFGVIFIFLNPYFSLVKPLVLNTLILFFCLFGQSSSGQNFLWAKSYKLAIFTNERDEGAGVCITPTNNILLTGYIENRMYIAEYDQNGVQNSTVEFTSNSRVIAKDIAVDQNSDIYITGEYTGTVTFGNYTLSAMAGSHDVFIAKLNPSYVTLWAKSLGGNKYDEGRQIATDDSGNVYLAGEMDGIFYYDSNYFQLWGKTDIFLAKYSPLGQMCWIKQIGGEGFDELGAMKIRDGYLYLTGDCTEDASFDTITVTGSASSMYVYTAKFNEDGHAIWVKCSQGVSGYSSGGWGSAIGINEQGEVFSSGFNKGIIIFENDTLIGDNMNQNFIVKYDSNGNVLSAKKIGGSGIGAADVGSDGGVHVTGRFWYDVIFGKDTLWAYGGTMGGKIFITKFSSNLDPVWAVNCGCTDWNDAHDLTIDNSDNIFVTGYYDGSTGVFWPHTLPSWGGETFLTKLHDYCVNIESPTTHNQHSIIYPNPCENAMQIDNKRNLESIKVYDLCGNLLASKKLEKMTNTIDLTHLIKGVYIVVLESTNGEKKAEKLIKM